MGEKSLDFGDIDLIFKATPALWIPNFDQKSLSAPYLFNQIWWILAKLYVLYHWDSQKILLDFGDLDFDQFCIEKKHSDMGKKWLDFGWLWPQHFEFQILTKTACLHHSSWPHFWAFYGWGNTVFLWKHCFNMYLKLDLSDLIKSPILARANNSQTEQLGKSCHTSEFPQALQNGCSPCKQKWLCHVKAFGVWNIKAAPMAEWWLRPLIFSTLNRSSHCCGFEPRSSHMWDEPNSACSLVFAPRFCSAQNEWNNLDGPYPTHHHHKQTNKKKKKKKKKKNQNILSLFQQSFLFFVLVQSFIIQELLNAWALVLEKKLRSGHPNTFLNPYPYFLAPENEFSSHFRHKTWFSP